MSRETDERLPSIRDVRRSMYRQQILTAAEYEFARSGFSDAKVSSIARTADLSLATLYKNFSGKDEIWSALNTQRMNEMAGMARAASDVFDSPFDRMLAGLRAQVEFFVQHPNFLRLHIAEGWNWATASESGRGDQRQVWRAGIALMTRAAQAAEAAGELDAVRPAIAAQLAIAALQVWLTDWIESGGIRPSEQVADEVVDHLRRAFAASKTNRRGKSTPKRT